MVEDLGPHLTSPTQLATRQLDLIAAALATGHHDLTITREPTPTGWLLRFSGPQARRPGLADDVMDKVVEWFGGG